MKIKPIYLLLVLVAVVLAACGGETPTPIVIVQTATPETLPTQAPPEVSADPVWDRIVSQGKIVVGTSADYPPFEYYDETYTQLTGFDVALIRNVAAKMGLEVELVDIAFEGLPTALQIGQIDAAIAAISVTPERQAMMDFSNVYYNGQDEILARSGANIDQLVTAAQLAPFRVGVQRGSVYATWLQQTLVTPGLMPEAHLLQYEKASDAVRDLRENRVDLVVLDKLAADEYIAAGDVVSVGRGLNTQLLAIAIPQGSPVLQEQLNNALTELKNEGTTARLAETFLESALSDVAVSVPTAVPGPTPTPAACTDAMKFVSDISIPDGTRVDPGEKFVKVWRIRNTGTCTWDQDYKLAFVQGNPMGGVGSNITSSVKPGETYDLAVPMQMGSNASGDRAGQWQMVNPDGKSFGERIWIKVRVRGSAPAPTATPVPPKPQAPSQPAGPVISNLKADPATANVGDVVVVSWDFSGQALVSARVTRTNPDGSKTPLYGGADVDLQGQYEDFLMAPGTYSYTLTVSSEVGAPAVETIIVTVQ